jgi:hypothetical protein
MKTVKLENNEGTFIYYIMKQYARTTENLDQEDRDEIMDLAMKFKND